MPISSVSFGGRTDKPVANLIAILAPVITSAASGVTIASAWTATVAAAAAAAPFFIGGAAIAGVVYGVAKLVEDDDTEKNEEGNK